MKKTLTLIKILVLISGAALALLRFVDYKYKTAFSPRQGSEMLKLSLVFAAVLVLSGLAWVLLEKRKAQKAAQGSTPTEEKGEASQASKDETVS